MFKGNGDDICIIQLYHGDVAPSITVYDKFNVLLKNRITSQMSKLALKNQNFFQNYNIQKHGDFDFKFHIFIIQ